MIELLGGPQDGVCVRKNPPKREVFIEEESGESSLDPRSGYTRYVQLGCCLGCGVRFDDCPDAKYAKYVPESQAPERECGLCGAKNPERT